MSAGAFPSRAGERPASGAWWIGLELQQRSFDTMSAGDARPIARGDAGVRISIDRLVTPRWALGLSAHFGGTWLDWSDPLYATAGKIEDAAWDVRLGMDRAIVVGARGMVSIGFGIEYAEARSWVHALGPPSGTLEGQSITDDGPHVYATGGYARLAGMVPVWKRVALSAQISESFYGAHATDPTFSTQYNWLGRSLAVSVGLRLEITHESSAKPKPAPNQ